MESQRFHPKALGAGDENRTRVLSLGRSASQLCEFHKTTDQMVFMLSILTLTYRLGHLMGTFDSDNRRRVKFHFGPSPPTHRDSRR